MPSSDSRKFRDTLGCFTTGVTVVATLDDSGQPRGITVSSFASVSLEPPMVLCCVANNAQCAAAFSTAEYFSVNILSAGQRLLSSRFAQRTENKWHGIEFDTWQSGVPILRDCLANLECRKVERIDAGDHTILVGIVLGLAHQQELAPLIYYRGAYERLEQKATVATFAQPLQACRAG